MTHQPANRTIFEDVAVIIVNWMTPKKSIHWIVPSDPEQPRIRFRVRPQFVDLLALAVTCEETYSNRFWRLVRRKRWKESRGALYNMRTQQIAGTFPVLVSQGRAIYLNGQPAKRVRQGM